MEAIADALIYAVTYINLRETGGGDDYDVVALESIAGYLHKASVEEQDALAAAAGRALAAELAGPSREEFVRDYKTWMEDMFGEEWIGNARAG